MHRRQLTPSLFTMKMARINVSITMSALLVVTLILLLTSLSLPSFAQKQPYQVQAAAKKLKFEIIKEAKHDKRLFTQGLLFNDGNLYESSGLYGRSRLRVYNAKSNALVKQQGLSRRIFAEGLTKIDNELYLLTWKASKLMVFNANDLQFKRSMPYQGEGWGLTNNGKHFIMSNGSAQIFFRDLKSFEIIKKITVKNRWRAYNKLNELEYAQGHIWANVWQSPFILKIAPDSGQIVGIADMSELIKRHQRSGQSQEKVLNGIAYDPSKEAFWVTGKLWSKRYLVRYR
ncbi:MAG: glutaminyl-peptide cyclotransferase [Alteromonadaceae bacterium]|nr:MAG: glutaminyl-peptide cyclotransferase [Alteromonadaceae bacterium]